MIKVAIVWYKCRNLFVNDDTNGPSGDVENASGGSVVDLVRHALLESSVALDVDDVSLAVAGEVGLEPDRPLLAEILGEHVTRSATDTLGVGHCV